MTHCGVFQCSEHIQHCHAAVQLAARHVVVEHLHAQISEYQRRGDHGWEQRAYDGEGARRSPPPAIPSLREADLR